MSGEGTAGTQTGRLGNAGFFRCPLVAEGRPPLRTCRYRRSRPAAGQSGAPGDAAGCPGLAPPRRLISARKPGGRGATRYTRGGRARGGASGPGQTHKTSPRCSAVPTNGRLSRSENFPRSPVRSSAGCGSSAAAPMPPGGPGPAPGAPPGDTPRSPCRFPPGRARRRSRALRPRRIAVSLRAGR